MNIIEIVVVVAVTLAIYELVVRPFLATQQVKKFESSSEKWIKLMGKGGYQDDARSIFNLYRETEFGNDQTDSKSLVAKLVFQYIMIVFRIENQNNIQSTSFSGENDDTVDKLVGLENKRHQLKLIIENLLGYQSEEN